MTEQEFSEAGDPIYRYENADTPDSEPAIGDPENIEAIARHIEQHVGNIESVFHEIVSDLVHIDIHWVKPSVKFPFHVLVTSGMSDKPMQVPDGLEGDRYAELCVLLPENWPIAGNNYQAMEAAFKDEKNYWPVRWLKIIARFPHQYHTWVGHGHTIPNGAEAAPFHHSTQLGCMLLMPCLSLGSEFFSLTINNEKTIHFYCLYPLYKEEMEFKLKKGADALLDKFDQFNVLDVLDTHRQNTCLKKGLLGWW